MVRWSPDSKAFIISKYSENTVEVYKVDKKKDGWLQASKALTFPKVSCSIKNTYSGTHRFLDSEVSMTIHMIGKKQIF